MKTLTLKKATFAAIFGFAALAVHATEWTFYASNATGNPASDKSACISDGNWVLKVEGRDIPSLSITLKQNCVNKGSGILDLREPTIGTSVWKLSFTKGRVFNGCKDLTEAYIDNVTSTGENTFENCTALTKVSLSGTFGALGKVCFKGCTALTSVVLSSPNLNAFQSEALYMTNHTLETLEITAGYAVTVDANTMSSTPVTTLIVNSPIWMKGSVDNLLKGVATTTADKNCTVYADKDAWADLATTLTDAEKDYKPKKCFGVYREGSRKAWLVSNVTDSSPFRIIIR